MNTRGGQQNSVYPTAQASSSATRLAGSNTTVLNLTIKNTFHILHLYSTRSIKPLKTMSQTLSKPEHTGTVSDLPVSLFIICVTGVPRSLSHGWGSHCARSCANRKNADEIAINTIFYLYSTFGLDSAFAEYIGQVCKLVSKTWPCTFCTWNCLYLPKIAVCKSPIQWDQRHFYGGIDSALQAYVRMLQ